jgi:hypothetical protein
MVGGAVNNAMIYASGSPLTFNMNGANRMSLDLNGNLTVDTNTLFVDAVNNRVGIGTESPSEIFSVRTGNTYAANFSTTQTSESTTIISIGAFSNGVGGSNGSVAIGSLHNHGVTANSSMLFYTHGGGAFAERMRLTHSGNLIINSFTDSGDRLQVTGDTRMTGEILLSDAKTSIVNGDYAVNFSKSYTPTSTQNNTNSYGLVSNLTYNLASGTYTGSESFNATASLAQVAIAGNATTKATQPFRAYMAGLLGRASSPAMNIADFRYFDIKSPDANGLSGHVVDNMYGLKIGQMNGATGFTITNSWGIYQEGASDNNYFNGKVLIGTATAGTSKLRVSGLPTSATGLSAGDIWNDSGTLKIA